MAELRNTSLLSSVAKDRLSMYREGPDILVFRLSGDWRLTEGRGQADAAVAAIDPTIKRVVFEDGGIGHWDSALVVLVTLVLHHCRQNNIAADILVLPNGVQRLVALADAVPPANTGDQTHRLAFVGRVGQTVLDFAANTVAVVNFLGELTLSGFRLLRGKARYRRSDFFYLLQQCGADALPIVTIISLLVGLILAFVGAVQLRVFGAEAYVANLVGIAVLREMGAIMTGIVLAGRTGAAFAAQIGAMQGNEEIDALSTLGVPAMDFLVLPRALALIIMMPLLCIYADVMGILGGLIVSTGMLNITTVGYMHQLLNAITLTQVFIGLSKSIVFGIIVAISGCMKGLNCGRSAADVGDAATQAVVMGILFIIVSDGVFAVILNYLGL